MTGHKQYILVQNCIRGSSRIKLYSLCMFHHIVRNRYKLQYIQFHPKYNLRYRLGKWAQNHQSKDMIHNYLADTRLDYTLYLMVSWNTLELSQKHSHSLYKLQYQYYIPYIPFHMVNILLVILLRFSIHHHFDYILACIGRYWRLSRLSQILKHKLYIQNCHKFHIQFGVWSSLIHNYRLVELRTRIHKRDTFRSNR